MAFHRRKFSVTEISVTENVTPNVTPNVTLKDEDVTENVTEDVTDEPELDPTVLYLTVLNQRVDALAAEITELKKVGSAIKIDSLMPVLKGMVEEVVESLETRIGKVEELLQDLQPGQVVRSKGKGYGGSKEEISIDDLPFSRKRQGAGKLPKGWN